MVQLTCCCANGEFPPPQALSTPPAIRGTSWPRVPCCHDNPPAAPGSVGFSRGDGGGHRGGSRLGLGEVEGTSSPPQTRGSWCPSGGWGVSFCTLADLLGPLFQKQFSKTGVIVHRGGRLPRFAFLRVFPGWSLSFPGPVVPFTSHPSGGVWVLAFLTPRGHRVRTHCPRETVSGEGLRHGFDLCPARSSSATTLLLATVFNSLFP